MIINEDAFYALGIVIRGNDKQFSTLWIVILVVLNENRGALSWRLVMSDKKFDIVYICNELIELDLSFLKSLPCNNKNFNCNTCT